MGRLLWLVAIVAVALPGCRVSRPPEAPDATRLDEWFGAYLQERKIGYMHVAIRPVVRDGRDLLEYVASDYIVLDVLGQRMEQSTLSVTLCGTDYRPLESEVTIRSGGRDMAVTATFHPDRIECRKTAGDNTVEKTVPIPEGVSLAVDERALVTDGRLKVGQSLEMHQFNPLTLGIDKHELKGLRAEPLTMGEETFEATVVELKSPYATAQVWIDQSGRMLQLELPLMRSTLKFQREDEATAVKLEEGEGPRVDLVVATAIRPSTPIVEPRRVERLTIKVKGLETLESVPSDPHQTVEALADGWQEVTVSAWPPEKQPTVGLPVKSERLKPFLQATTYIESDHPEMKAAVAKILGDGETDARAAARKIEAWVHEHVVWQANIGLFRSALEVLRDPAGVCRDAAALYTALARAAGIPTRVCAGLVYVNGAFMGHAWAESWIGDWVPFDATIVSSMVDATHLKLAQGEDYTCLFDMLPALGALAIEVVSYEPGPSGG